MRTRHELCDRSGTYTSTRARVGFAAGVVGTTVKSRPNELDLRRAEASACDHESECSQETAYARYLDDQGVRHFLGSRV